MTQRIVQNAPASLRVECFDANGELTSADLDPMTVGVVTASGASVIAAGTAATTVDDGVFTVPVTAAMTAELDRFIATWTADDGSVRTSTHDIVGGFLWSVAEARRRESSIADNGDYTDEQIIEARTEVEEELESITDRAFTARYRRVVVDGTGATTLVLPVGDIRAIRSVRALSSAGSSSYTAFTEAQLAGLVFAAGQPLNPGDPTLRRTDYSEFTEGFANHIIEVEYGIDVVPEDLKRATIYRLRQRLNMTATGVPDRATGYTAENGATYKLDQADTYKVGIPEIDAVYSRYSRRRRGDKAVPASRQLRMQTQRGSLFHGTR